MDISDTLAPDSQQLDAVDLLGGPRTFVIESVSKGPADQPVQVHLQDFPRPWRPGKSMRRVLAACWGTDASLYVGRRVTLYCDPDVIFGKDKVGGTRISHLSHLDKPKSVPLLVSRGKSATYIVEPLTEPASRPDPTAADVTSCTDVETLRQMHEATTDRELRALIRARKAELQQPADGPLIPSGGAA